MIELMKVLQLLRNFIHCSAPVKVTTICNAAFFLTEYKRLYLIGGSVHAC